MDLTAEQNRAIQNGQAVPVTVGSACPFRVFPSVPWTKTSNSWLCRGRLSSDPDIHRGPFPPIWSEFRRR